MLIAISGSQGSGKSTIISKLKEKGYPTITRKTSRSILKDWGVTLNEINNNPELTIKFQEEILERKKQDELSAYLTQNVVFTERTYADLFTYALVSLGKDNRFDDWLNDYYIRCMEYNQHYTNVFYLRAGHFNIESDGVRGANPHYSRMVDITMLDITTQMIHNSKLSIIDTPNLQQRVAMIEAQSIPLIATNLIEE